MANLTSPCLQRLAHPAILLVTHDTAGQGFPSPSQDHSSCSSPLRWKWQMTQLLLVQWVNQHWHKKQRRVCSSPLYCLTSCWAGVKKKKQWFPAASLFSLPHFSSAFSIPPRNESKLVTARQWDVYERRVRIREMERWKKWEIHSSAGCQRCSYIPSFQETSSQCAASLWEWSNEAILWTPLLSLLFILLLCFFFPSYLSISPPS